MSRIITFYSYKGGVGRTFALANIGVLLARRGKRVLMMDWDLEAPGLHRYFKRSISKNESQKKGLIHLLSEAQKDSSVTWEKYVIKISVEGCRTLHMIQSGDQESDYIERIKLFSWDNFFENRRGGDVLDRWRREWRTKYDFVLVDSRTGITDTGGVGTVYLPDILVFVFAANEQSFDRGVEVVTGVQLARRKLSVPRPPLAILPLPGRFDGRDEVDEAQSWLNRFAKELKPFYDDWLPKEFQPRQIIELTKVPYITKLSFGEPLPVITQGITDPEFPGFYLENSARLLASDFRDARQILSPESTKKDDSVSELRALLASVPIDETAVDQMLKIVETEIGSEAKFSELLFEAGSALSRQQRINGAETYFRQAITLNSEIFGPNHPTSLTNLNALADLLTMSGRFTEAEMFYRQVAEGSPDSNHFLQLTAFVRLASICRLMGNLDDALTWYHRATAITEIKGIQGDVALEIYNNIASVYRELGQKKEALLWYEKALTMTRITKRTDDPAILTTYNNLASVYHEMGNKKKALIWHERSLAMAKRIGRPDDDPMALATYNNLARIYRDMGQQEKAIAWYERALVMAKRTGRLDDPAVLASYNNLASVYREMYLPEKAIALYERALEMTKQIGRPDDNLPALATYNNLAETFIEEQQIQKAEELLKHILKAVQYGSYKNNPDVARTKANLAQILENTGRHEEAAKIYKQI